MDYRAQPLHQFLIALAKIVESVSLPLKYIREGLGTFAVVELRGKAMGV